MNDQDRRAVDKEESPCDYSMQNLTSKFCAAPDGELLGSAPELAITWRINEDRT